MEVMNTNNKITFLYKSKYYKEEDFEDKYYESSKRIKNQKILVCFQERFSKHLGSVYFNVYLRIENKRTENLYRKTTGECGLQGLLFAKNSIIEFEKFIVNNNYYQDKRRYIHVSWDDNRRRDIYKRTLEKIGFRISKVNSRSILIKKI